MSDLVHFMAAMRRVESGELAGNYEHQQESEGGYRPIGAYGFINWPQQAAAAGLPEANISDRRAQDTVAGTLFRDLYAKYQNWDLVALAWFTNEKTADQVFEGGYAELSQITNPRVNEYMQSVTNALAEADASGQEFQSPTLEGGQPLSKPLTPGEPPQKYRASELMAHFVDQMSNSNAGGTRIPIEDLAPKVIPTDPSKFPPIAEASDTGVSDQTEGEVTPDGN